MKDGNIAQSESIQKALTDGVILRRTTHGIVHVTAPDYHGIGYGVGYAYTQDNRCLLARRIAEVNDRLSEQLGADTPVRNEVHKFMYTALQSDHYYRGWFDKDAIRAGFNAGAPEVVELAKGYAADVNKYRADHPGKDPCMVAFKGEVTLDDVLLMWVATATVTSGEMIAGYLPHALPSAAPEKIPEGFPMPPSGGSNAWALGRETTREGKSIHLYNPHFPWTGIQRLYMIHVTIPNKLNVMGVTLGGFPIPLAGFTDKLAWGLTLSPAARWTVAELTLAGDPMTYQVDGTEKKIKEEILSIPVLGESKPRKVPFYRAAEGPIINAPAFFMPWSISKAYTAHDVNADNTRMVEQFLRIAQSKNVHELQKQLAAIQGVPWSYVVVSDANGDVFFGDVSNIPGLSAEDIARCGTPAGQMLLMHSIVVLDGSRSECTWSNRMSPEMQPQVIRSDYVANSNNNYEIPNLNQKLMGSSPILGMGGQPLSLRASLGLQMISDRLNGSDGLGDSGFTRELVLKVFQQARNRAAELLVDDIVADCRKHSIGEYNGKTVDLKDVCEALANWDKRNTLQSRGAGIFRGLWMALAEAKITPSLFQTPASLDKPLDTPSGYSTDPVVRKAVRDALARVANTLAEKGIALNAQWGDIHKIKTPLSAPMPTTPLTAGALHWAGTNLTLSMVPAICTPLFSARTGLMPSVCSLTAKRPRRLRLGTWNKSRPGPRTVGLPCPSLKPRSLPILTSSYKNYR